LTKRVILTGPKSSGKSNIGVRLAELMGVPFFDLDELLEDIFEKESGTRLSFREIFRRHGEEKFRALELQAAQEVVSKDRVLLSTGGTTFTIPALRETLVPDSYIVLLKNSPEELWLRTSRKGIPSYLEKEIDPRAAFFRRVEGVIETVTPIAHLSMDTEDLTIEDVAQVLDVELSQRRVFE
jgi:shikimate kinase